ncbi:MAG: hypothetical protein ABI747_01300 [Candidatus Moraniibacteriota bacterium]
MKFSWGVTLFSLIGIIAGGKALYHFIQVHGQGAEAIAGASSLFTLGVVFLLREIYKFWQLVQERKALLRRLDTSVKNATPN